jgi:hypothetical protein
VTLEDLKQLSGLGVYAPSQYPPLAGSNISITANEKRQYEREHNILPGTDAWFRLWFSLPYMTKEKPFGNK